MTDTYVRHISDDEWRGLASWYVRELMPIRSPNTSTNPGDTLVADFFAANAARTTRGGVCPTYTPSSQTKHPDRAEYRIPRL